MKQMKLFWHMHVCVLEINLPEYHFDIHLNLLYHIDIVTKWCKADKFHKTYFNLKYEP